MALLDTLHEPFSGELVLHDLERVGAEDTTGARTILIRFLAAQYFTNVLRGDWPSHLLRLQRSAALNAIGTGLVLDRELRLVRSALQSCAGEWPRSAVALLLRAAVDAGGRGHHAGAHALYRIAYEAAVTQGWWTEAAGAALAIASLEDVPGAAHASTRWRRRARVLERNAARAAEQV